MLQRYAQAIDSLRNGIGSWGGESIFEYEWDVAVVLDACRADTFRETAAEFSIPSPDSTIRSVGGTTWEWMPRTFEQVEDEVLADVTYICANPYSEKFLTGSRFDSLDEVWRYGWDESLGTVHPRTVTDRAIAVGRESDWQRLLVHYVQPHTPFIGSESSPALSQANFGGTNGVVVDDWRLVERGERDPERAIADYVDNLRLVLEEVELLRENINAETFVITSDHGNLLGEYGLYGHPGGIPLPALKEVPWAEMTATDQHTHMPKEYDTDLQDIDVEDRLEALGYK